MVERSFPTPLLSQPSEANTEIATVNWEAEFAAVISTIHFRLCLDEMETSEWANTFSVQY